MLTAPFKTANTALCLTDVPFRYTLKPVDSLLDFFGSRLDPGDEEDNFLLSQQIQPRKQ